MRLTPRKVFFLLAAAPLLALSAAARPAPAPAAKVSSPEEYAERLLDVAVHLGELADLCEQISINEKPEVWEKGQADPDLALELPDTEEEAFAAAHELLPPNERVAAPGGGEVQVDNSWLYSALDDYRALSDNDKRAAAARGMSERLAALAARLTEGQAAAPRDKDAEKGRLNNILSRPEYDRERQEEGGALQRLIESFVEWLRELLRQLIPDVGPVQPRAGAGLTVWAQVLVFGLSGAVLAYVIYLLVRLWRAREPRRKRKGKREARVVLGERLEADKSAADLLEEAEGLARSGDLRGAIRKAYVALLCELGDRHVVRLAQNKTNRDYLRDVAAAARTRLYTEMLPLTYSFELHWYGLQDASESDWADFRARCRQALKQTGASG